MTSVRPFTPLKPTSPLPTPNWAARRSAVAALSSLALLLTLAPPTTALANEVASLSNKDAAAGIKEALVKGAEAAVGQLGQPNGFLGNDRVKIPLPGSLQKAERSLRMFGMGRQVDELSDTMNHAAEQAVVRAKPILVNAVKSMSVRDAKAILLGDDDAATQYFKRATSADIQKAFVPIVQKATARLQLADKYNRYAGDAARFGLIDPRDADLDSYITHKTMDGLFLLIADKEKAIRADPIGAGSSLLKSVFGATR